MILPHPESDLSINMLVLASDIIRLLKNRRLLLIEDVMESFLNVDKKRTPEMFINTLTFLYTCGFIQKEGYKIRLMSRELTLLEMN